MIKSSLPSLLKSPETILYGWSPVLAISTFDLKVVCEFETLNERKSVKMSSNFFMTLRLIMLKILQIYFKLVIAHFSQVFAFIFESRFDVH